MKSRLRRQAVKDFKNLISRTLMLAYGAHNYADGSVNANTKGFRCKAGCRIIAQEHDMRFLQCKRDGGLFTTVQCEILHQVQILGQRASLGTNNRVMKCRRECIGAMVHDFSLDLDRDQHACEIGQKIKAIHFIQMNDGAGIADHGGGIFGLHRSLFGAS